MRTYRVVFSPKATRDLDDLADYIADKGGPRAAKAYTTRMRDFCRRLDIFPERGTALPNGTRLLGFEDSANIVFRVSEDHVDILTVAYRGRSID